MSSRSEYKSLLENSSNKRQWNPKIGVPFGESFSVEADYALGIPCCTYIELLADNIDIVDYNFKKNWNERTPPEKYKKNIVFSIQKADWLFLEDYIKKSYIVDEVAFFLADLKRSVYGQYVMVELNTQIIDAILQYKEENPDIYNGIVALYDAIYIGKDEYVVNHLRTRISPITKEKFKTYKGCRMVFYVNQRPIRFYPIVKHPITIEDPKEDGKKDTYSPDKKDTEEKKKQATKDRENIMLLATAALTLLN
ncbi:MAG: hypothetical protein NC346_09030 [Prevotella sp.]|nr:hypothetical protein [Prevotella sp.]MCM1443665.1 hypothetical protein [Muribaculum sp.]MCM1577152.1 hypothetical protein [Bacteroides sp.]